MLARRVTVCVGHFGSGKTEIALNLALDLAAAGEPVALVDADVVKPYFRSRTARDILVAAGVDLVAPAGENFHADLPIIVPQIRGMLREPGRRVILDVGGDDSGARVLGSLADVLPADETDCLVVLNFRRPGTPNAAAAVTMVREIAMVGRLEVTGLVSNTHLMDETTIDVVLAGLDAARATAAVLGVPVVAVAVQAGDRPLLDGVDVGCPVLSLRRIIRPLFEQSRQTRTSGPLFAVD